VCAPAGYLENAEQVGNQQIVVPTTLEQFDLTFCSPKIPKVSAWA
jgi:hypothetical protein